MVIVILLVIIGLFAYGTFNQPTETQTPVVTNHTDIKLVNNTEVVYVANETGSGSNVFSLDARSLFFRCWKLYYKYICTSFKK